VNQSEAQVSRLSRQATADAKEVVNYAFRLAVVLIVVAGVVLVLVLRLVRRTNRTSPAPKMSLPGANQ
jgi:uncharacterized Tic20 family protein